MRKVLFIILIALAFTNCGNDYRSVLKSNDLEYKLEMAIHYYNQENYDKAYPIFDELLTLYRGTAKSQDVYYYYCMCLYKQKNYILAGYHFKNMYKTFPRHSQAEDAAFMTAFCYYLEAPKYSLDQAYTYKAINELQLFINTHPGSMRNEEANMLIDELREKLEKKAFDIAKVYYRTQHYQSAVLAFGHVLNDYPDIAFREEAMFYKLESAYKLAENSIYSKQEQRFKEARTAYYDLVDSFPESKFTKDAEGIFEKIELELKQLNNKEA